jgi:hypothetical protein
MNLNKFAKSAETSGSVILVNTPDVVTQAGTPFSVENMDKMDQGIYDAHKAIADHLAEEPFGYEIPFDFEPTALQLATWRCLPKQGQMIQIALYQRLADMMYCGDAANATADWWYKTADPQGTVRDVNGAYMRVQDKRGMFTRGAGQNSKYKMANDAPYDGMAIGSFGKDTVIEHQHIFGIADTASTNAGIAVRGCDQAEENYRPTFAIAQTDRYGPETRPVSISAYLCIKY